MKNIPQLPLRVGLSCIIPSTSVRDLGVRLDNTLNLHEHVSYMEQSCFFQLRQLKQIKRLLSAVNIKALLHAFVTSRLDYCNSLLAGQPAGLLDRLQSIQNAAAHVYAGISSRSHVTSIL